MAPSHPSGPSLGKLVALRVELSFLQPLSQSGLSNSFLLNVLDQVQESVLL